jgi:hypothetical protein
MKKQIILIFTFSIFIFESASAQQQQSYESNPPEAKSNINQNITNTGKFKNISRISVNDKFNVFDYQWDHKIGALYYGLSGSISSTIPFVATLYAHGAYIYPLNDKLNLWGSAGYMYTIIEEQNNYIPGYGLVTIPSASAGAITWQVGADFFISKKFGLTAYSYEVKSFFIGIVFRDK